MKFQVIEGKLRGKGRLRANLQSLWIKKNGTARAMGFPFFFFFTYMRCSIMKYGALITKAHVSFDKAIREEQCLTHSTTPNSF